MPQARIRRKSKYEAFVTSRDLTRHTCGLFGADGSGAREWRLLRDEAVRRPDPCIRYNAIGSHRHKALAPRPKPA